MKSFPSFFRKCEICTSTKLFTLNPSTANDPDLFHDLINSTGSRHGADTVDGAAAAWAEAVATAGAGCETVTGKSKPRMNWSPRVIDADSCATCETTAPVTSFTTRTMQSSGRTPDCTSKK